MRASVWRFFLGLSVACSLAIALVDGDLPVVVMYFAVLLAVLIAIVVGLRRHRPRRSGPWRALICFIVVTLAGDMAANFIPVESQMVVPLADILYSLSYLPLLVAVLLLIKHSAGGRDSTTMIDTSIIVISLAMLAWVFVLEPTARNSGDELAGTLAILLSPFADVLLMALLVRMSIGGGVRNSAIMLLTVGFVLGLVGDTATAVLPNYGIDEVPGHLIEVCYLLAYACFGASALHPSMSTATQAVPEPGGGRWARRRALLAIASLLAPIVLLTQSIQGDYSSVPVVAITCMALFLLVVTRMSGLVERVQAQAQRLDQIAHTDGLTRVPNRRAWDAALVERVGAARRTGSALHVAILDLDHFKRFNDTYGHQAGDEVLRESAEAWSAALRSGDLLARYGGEEFTVVILGGTPTDAVVVIDRLRAVTPLNQTFSAGVATWNTHEQPDELLKRADKALYEAKQAGRNRVHLVDTGTDLAAPVPAR